MSAMVEYIRKDSFFHRLNPITKIVWTFTVIALSFIFSNPLAIFAVFITSIVLVLSIGIFKQVFPIIKGLFVFSLLFVLFQVFLVTEGNTLFYAIPYFNIGRVTDRGLEMSAIMSLRMITTVSTIPLLMMTTPMTDIVTVLVEKLKIPFKYAFMFITAIRFIPMFMNEMEQILQAQMSRGYSSDTKNPFKKLFIVIPLAIPLLVSSIRKTGRTAVSMEVRGFGSGPRSQYRKIKMQKADYFILVLFIITTMVSLFIKRIV